MHAIRLIDLSDGSEVPWPTDLRFALALGNFDGVHLAHRALLTSAVQKAASIESCHSAVFCFDPPSSYYLARNFEGHLSTLQEKLAIFASCGIEYAFLADFPSLRDMTAETFIWQILRDVCHAEAVVCGFNFRFGQGGKGDFAMLKEAFGISRTEVIAPYSIRLPDEQGEVIVSSTQIRTALRCGDVCTAQTMLGEPYRFTSPVVRGKQLGRTLGIPTVNQFAPEGKLLPAEGIYVTRALIGSEWVGGVSNVGVHPTVDEHAVLNCETHLLCFEGDIYDSVVTIEFLQRLRDEKRFDTVQELRDAIQKDIRTATEYFNH
ncbi:MAG: riboflavin biosynthesis protein RibF [Clostridia bacterium]|nr:riboflavin biosynthesis protein RibF [Clostridia bacterium]